jgi:transcription antitermination factor NusG
MVIKADKNELTVVVNIFGRDTEVPINVKQVKLLD